MGSVSSLLSSFTSGCQSWHYPIRSKLWRKVAVHTMAQIAADHASYAPVVASGCRFLCMTQLDQLDQLWRTLAPSPYAGWWWLRYPLHDKNSRSIQKSKANIESHRIQELSDNPRRQQLRPLSPQYVIYQRSCRSIPDRCSFTAAEGSGPGRITPPF